MRLIRSTSSSRIFNPDTPDLYFKAYRAIGFFKIPIYAPTPVGCHTRWNYRCGTEVVLYTTSPWARTCAPCPPVEAPDNWVLVMAIGNLSLANIRGASLASTTMRRLNFLIPQPTTHFCFDPMRGRSRPQKGAPSPVSPLFPALVVGAASWLGWASWRRDLFEHSGELYRLAGTGKTIGELPIGPENHVQCAIACAREPGCAS